MGDFLVFMSMDGAHSVPENIVKCGEKKRGKGEGGSMQWPRECWRNVPGQPQCGLQIRTRDTLTRSE